MAPPFIDTTSRKSLMALEGHCAHMMKLKTVSSMSSGSFALHLGGKFSLLGAMDSSVRRLLFILNEYNNSRNKTVLSQKCAIKCTDG
jgi:hypothetical protein